LKNKEDGGLGKDKTMDNVQKRNISTSGIREKACNSFGREVLYSILIGFELPLESS
jgi:hypothetical protein